MPYLIATLLAFVAAIVLLFSRYEADDSIFKAEIEKFRTMFVTIDEFVNTYTQSGGKLKEINFQEMKEEGVMYDNVTVLGNNEESTMSFKGSEIVWHIIPRNRNSSKKKDNSSYKVLIDFRSNVDLMNKPRFAESFASREFCENTLFGDYSLTKNSYNSSKEDFVDDGNGLIDDGIFECTIFK